MMPLCILIMLSACTNNNEDLPLEDPEQAVEQELSFEEQILAVPNNSFSNPEVITAYSEVMKEVLTMSKDSDFRGFVYKNAKNLSDSGDDYVVHMDKVVKSYKGSQKFERSVSKIETLTSRIQELDHGARAMVFYPKAETIEDNVKKNKGFDVAKNMDEPIAVLKGAYNDDYSAPGYKLAKNGSLVFDRMVTEEDAWENDVYVIGASEDLVEYAIDPCYEKNGAGRGCYSGGPRGDGGGGGTNNSNLRTNGRAEQGGLIQVTDLNAIEHWFSGKLEFRMIVSGVQGSAATVIRDIPFPRIKRKEFKDKKWYDYKVFLFNWNLPNLGAFNIEKWIERDGGTNSEITISVPGSAYKPATSTTPAVPAFPGGSVKVSIKRDDDDLGTSIVQFSDRLTTLYPLGLMNFKRN